MTSYLQLLDWQVKFYDTDYNGELDLNTNIDCLRLLKCHGRHMRMSMVPT